MLIVGLSGNSGSGKTFILNEIKKKFNDEISVISLDNYYKPIEFQEKDKNGIENFDLPSGINHLQLLNDINALLNDQSITFKTYNFNNPNKAIVYETVLSKKIILIEGIFCFCYPEINSLFNLKVFIDTPLDITFERRLKRDTLERGISYERVIYQWENHALPSFVKYVLPHKENSDFIIYHSNFEEDLNNLLFQLNQLILNHGK